MVLTQSRVTEPRLGEPFRPQLAAVAMTAGDSFGRRVVTTVGQSIVDAQLIAELDDLGLGQLDQRSMDLKPRPSTPALVARFASCSNAVMNSGRQSGYPL